MRYNAVMRTFAVIVALTIWLAISAYGIRQSYRRKQRVLLGMWAILASVVAAYIILSLWINGRQ
jgi:hypothetical protein